MTGGIVTLPKKLQTKNKETYTEKVPSKKDTLVIGEDFNNLDYSLASCCNPIPGDDVFGFVTVSEGIRIHRQNCPNAQQLLSKYAYRVIKATWKSKTLQSFTADISFIGIDDIGIVKSVDRGSIRRHEHQYEVYQFRIS